MHAWDLRLRGVPRVLAMAPPPVLPSAMRNDVGTPVAIISQLKTLPACTPVNASMAALRLATHDLGPGMAKNYGQQFSTIKCWTQKRLCTSLIRHRYWRWRVLCCLS